MNLRTSKVLVTGGTGFIGRPLCRLLREKCGEVRVLIRNLADETVLTKQGLIPILGDISSHVFLQKASKGCNIVCHLAAGSGSLETARKINVEGTRNVLDAAISAGVEKVITLSSVAVYGSKIHGTITEDFPLINQGTPYAVTKVNAEQLIDEYREKKNLDVVVIRPSLVYGPQSPIWTIALFERIKNDQIFLVNFGEGLMNLIYVDDLVRLIIEAAGNDRSKNATFNANNEERVFWAQYLEAMCTMLHKKRPLSISSRRAYALWKYYEWKFRFTRIDGPIIESDLNLQQNDAIFSAQKAKQMIGFEPQFSFLNGMNETNEWLKSEGYIGKLFN